jgi:alpha-tubulin suppressor-like RCC1 family protein
MTERWSVVTSRVLVVFAMVVLGTITWLQVSTAVPAGAAASSVGVFAWGDNSTGELGNESIGGSSGTPAPVALPAGVTPTAIAAGGGGGGTDTEAAQLAAYAIGSDGKLYAWGDNSNGALGNGTTSTTGSATPVVVSLPAGVTPTAISAAQGTGYAIGSDGKLYAWGDNLLGKLGNGSTASNSTSPVVVSLPSGVTPTAVAGGYESAYAIGSDGHLYAWGDNSIGELGDGTNTNSATPVVVSLPAGVTPTAIAGGGGAGYAIGSDGNLYAWGLNQYGELGNNSTTNSMTPVVVQLPSGVTAKAITAGGGFAHAIGSDGNLYGWGLGNTGGQLGLGSESSLVPLAVPLAAGVQPKAIADNLHTGYAIGSDGHMYAWGYGLAGELGDGSESGDISPPVVVSLPAGSTPESLGAEPGAQAGYAIVSAPETAPAVSVQPVSQTVFAGTGVSFTATPSAFPFATAQWQQSTDGGSTWNDISGATSPTYTISAVPLSDNGDQFRAVFTNLLGSATTDPATLMVNAPVAPAIITQPTSQTVSLGETVSFSGLASGAPPPTAQWQESTDGGSTWNDISGATTPAYTITNVTASDNGDQFRVVFTNIAGSVTTNPATLMVTVSPPTTTVSLPSNGVTITGGSWLDASASSPVGIASVNFEVSGNSISDMVVSPGFSTIDGWIGGWDTTDVPNGTYTLQSVATDTLGQSTTSAGVTVTVDNLPLHTEVLVPSDGATLSGTSAVLDASATGTSDVTSVQFVVSNSAVTDQVVATAVLTLYGWIAFWQTTAVPNGTYTLQSVATEVGGTMATSPGITVTVQNPA